jgi:hypothetical protein
MSEVLSQLTRWTVLIGQDLFEFELSAIPDRIGDITDELERLNLRLERGDPLFPLPNPGSECCYEVST